MASNTRHDGRQDHEFRTLNISYDGLARVDGSARFGFGDTSALASISGPIEVRLVAEQASQATFEVLLRPLSNVPATEAKALGATIRSALAPSLILTKNPRTLVQLVVQSLSSKGDGTQREALTAAMINASTLALLNAGSVPMRGVVCAIPVGRCTAGDRETRLFVDPGETEISEIQGGGCFAFVFGDKLGWGDGDVECVWTNWKSTSGTFDENELSRARELALKAARAVYAEIKRGVKTMGAVPFKFNEKRVKEDVKKGLEAELKTEEGSNDEKMEIS
ncbi:ribosomal protein S5 domain 2-type protein [Crucibulum laeve]|uniref:Ribosomal protein S5 domain 2-type protein n=1 Tax=Crucibulum laeve TaxID=68775 RepID=A0A5C3LH49_9AGAR|nr:ribosomal protein S5 domain 2-type protein [Crucibulum laeve]